MFLGFVAGGSWLWIEARRRHWPREEIVPIALGAFVGGMLGARLSILFFNGPETARVVLDFFALFDPRIGPGSILGGVAGGYIGGYIAAKAIGKEGCTCDAFAPALALALAVGRIGDHLSVGEGLGVATGLPWGVPVFGLDYLVHPVAIYDSLFNLVWFATLITLRDHPKMQDGNLFKLGIGGYALFRFFNEFLRTNRIVAFGLTGQQYFCIAAIAILIVYYGRSWAASWTRQSA